MSHKVTTLVYSRKAGSAHRKAVLAYMADRASDDGSGVWASKKTIADEIECGRSTVIKICNEFVAEGILLPTGTRRCANGATIEYAINIEFVRALPNVKASTSGTSADQDQSTSGTPPVRQRDAKASTSGTQTIHEPSMNQDTIVSLDPNDVFLGKPPPKKQTRSSQIPDGWVPSDRNIQDAIERQFSPEEIDHEANQFRDHHLAKGSVFKDWNAAWRTWLGNSRKFSRGRGVAGSSGGKGHGRGSSIASIVARRRLGGEG